LVRGIWKKETTFIGRDESHEINEIHGTVEGHEMNEIHKIYEIHEYKK